MFEYLERDNPLEVGIARDYLFDVGHDSVYVHGRAALSKIGYTLRIRVYGGDVKSGASHQPRAVSHAGTCVKHSLHPYLTEMIESEKISA